MARTTKLYSRKKTSQTDMVLDTASLSQTAVSHSSNKRFIKIGIAVVLLAVIAGLLARRYTSTLVAATVNGMPILRSDLNTRLVNRFGSQMLEAMIGEKLIVDAATKQTITVTDAELKAKIDEISKSLTGSMSLDDSLKLQGISRVEFENQVKIQLMIDKMFAKDATVSTEEIDAFIKTDGAVLTATTDAEKKIQAEQELKSQKVSQKFIEWFNKIKEEAKINKFL